MTTVPPGMIADHHTRLGLELGAMENTARLAVKGSEARYMLDMAVGDLVRCRARLADARQMILEREASARRVAEASEADTRPHPKER